MEILNKLKSIVGLGAPTIELSLRSVPVHGGQPLRGVFVLRGGDYDAPVQDVEVRLIEERLVYPTPGLPERQFWRRVAEVVVAMDGRVLRKGDVLEQPFELVMPIDLKPSAPPVSYMLIAETEVPGLNPRAELAIEVEAAATL